MSAANNHMVMGPASFGIRRPTRISTASARMRVAMYANSTATSENTGADQVTLVGTALVFGIASRPDANGTKIVFQKGCLTAFLSRSPDLYATFNFREDRILGRTSAGTLLIYEFGALLNFEVHCPDTVFMNDLLISIQRKDITGSACGVSALTTRSEYRDNAKLVVVETAELVQGVAICSWPAFDNSLTTNTAAKSAAHIAALSSSDQEFLASVGIKEQKV